MFKLKKFIAKNLTLFTIMLCASAVVLARDYFFGWNYLPDLPNYLEVAQRILHGKGFHVYPGWFSVWPIGYPFLIAIVSFITRADVYFAAVIISVITIFAIGFTLYKRFGCVAWAYALILLSNNLLVIFRFIESEVPFVLAIILFSFWVSDIITEDTVKVSQYTRLTFGALFLFFTRYVGVFSVGVIGLLWLGDLYFVVKHKDKIALKRVVYLTISGAVSAGVMVSYLLLNKYMTGFMTGKRVPETDKKGLLANLFEAQLIEMNNIFASFFDISSVKLALPLYAAFISFVLYCVYKNIDLIKRRDKDAVVPFVFIAVGLVYWCAIVAMRFAVIMDSFTVSQRFLGPLNRVILYRVYRAYPAKQKG